MTVKDCIINAARFLNLKELEESLKGDTPDAGEFLDMARDVIAEICSDYYPLKITESAVADSDGAISLYSLNRPVIDVYKVTRGGKDGRCAGCGVSMPFIIKYDRIDVGFSGGCEVEYSYMPDLSGLDSELPFTDRVSARIIGYGIAAEYCLLNSPEDAALYDKRYKDSLKKAVAFKSEKRIKRRSWL